MTVKEIALNTIKQMPDDTTWDTLQARINFMAGVRKGLSELDERQRLPHDRVKEDLAKWLTRQFGRPPLDLRSFISLAELLTASISTKSLSRLLVSGILSVKFKGRYPQNMGLTQTDCRLTQKNS